VVSREEEENGGGKEVLGRPVHVGPSREERKGEGRRAGGPRAQARARVSSWAERGKEKGKRPELPILFFLFQK
jgi:hypothetical protein